MDVNDTNKKVVPGQVSSPENISAKNQLLNKIKNKLGDLKPLEIPKIELDTEVSFDPSKFSALEAKLKNSNKIELTLDLNQVITTLNQSTDSIGKIDKLVQSIDGLVEQASSNDLPVTRREILEKEANVLVHEIKKISNEAPTVLKAEEADNIRQKLEKNLGKTLDAILPGDESPRINIGDINFSTKDNILSVRTNVELAKAQVNELKERVNKSKDQLQNVVVENDVAEANREASQVSLRDIDQALSLAGKTRGLITQNPEVAIASVGEATRSYNELLS